MYEIKIYYGENDYKCETYHPHAFNFGEVLSLVGIIVRLAYHTMDIDYQELCHNTLIIWLHGRCLGCVIIEKVELIQSEQVSQTG